MGLWFVFKIGYFKNFDNLMYGISVVNVNIDLFCCKIFNFDLCLSRFRGIVIYVEIL